MPKLSPCSCRKYVEAGWLVRCAACGADTLTAVTPASETLVEAEAA